MIIIRPFVAADYQAVKKILQKSKLYWDSIDNEQSLERKIKEDKTSIVVAVENKVVVGIQMLVTDLFPFLYRLAVHPDYRNKGIGKKLMLAGENILKEKGFSHVNILVADDDKNLQKSYEKQGYEKGHVYRWMTKEF